MPRDLFEHYADIRRVLNKHDPLGTHVPGRNDHTYDPLIESVVQVTRDAWNLQHVATRLKAVFEVMYGASKVRATEWAKMAEELQDALPKSDYGG